MSKLAESPQLSSAEILACPTVGHASRSEVALVVVEYICLNDRGLVT